MFVFKIVDKQDVRPAIRILGKAVFMSGFNVQVFNIDDSNEYSYKCSSGLVKADKNPVFSRQVEMADIVLSYDVNSAKDLKDGGILILNSADRINTTSLKKKKIKVFYVDADGLSIDLKVPESVIMLGAFVKVFDKVSLKKMKDIIEMELKKEYVNAIDVGYKSVKRG